MPDEQEPVDRSSGYEAVADRFIRHRDRSIGVSTVRSWAKSLPGGAAILDLGCGHGVPISDALIKDGFVVYGVDASRTLISEFHRRLPQAPFACEAVEESLFFRRTFDGIVAVGLLFLLGAAAQERLIGRLARALTRGGRFLFTAPVQRATWEDVLTGHQSVSLGNEEYVRLLDEAGLALEAEYRDEGENHYYACIRG